MFCDNCGEFVDSGEKYCRNCGSPMGGNHEEPPKKERMECSYGKKVNKIAYVLLSIFLGPLGIHKFYGGRTGLGIVYIILTFLSFGTITFILGLIEGIIAACRKSDENGNIVISEHNFFL